MSKKKEKPIQDKEPVIKSEPKKKVVYVAQETFFFNCDGISKTIKFNSEFSSSDFPDEEYMNKILLNVKHKTKE